MALKVSPPFKHGGLEYDYLHLRNASNGAPETDESPFGVVARFRPYKLTGTEKSFAPTDKIPLREITVKDIEAKAVEWATAGRIEDAGLLADAMDKYQQALALFLEDEYPELTVDVV
jgi:hypothetical protein